MIPQIVRALEFQLGHFPQLPGVKSSFYISWPAIQARYRELLDRKSNLEELSMRLIIIPNWQPGAEFQPVQTLALDRAVQHIHDLDRQVKCALLVHHIWLPRTF